MHKQFILFPLGNECNHLFSMFLQTQVLTVINNFKLEIIAIWMLCISPSESWHICCYVGSQSISLEWESFILIMLIDAMIRNTRDLEKHKKHEYILKHDHKIELRLQYSFITCYGRVNSPETKHFIYFVLKIFFTSKVVCFSLL